MWATRVRNRYLAVSVFVLVFVAQLSRAEAQVPGAWLECEGDQCTRGGGGALWVFDGKQGEAQWRYGAVAAMTVRSFDGRTVVIERADPPGTYSSRWAGRDGYFRAVYRGVIRGNRVDGTVAFNGNSEHPGTWFATFTNTPCSGGSPCPLNLDQVRQLGARAAEARLIKAAAICSRITGVQNTQTGNTPQGTTPSSASPAVQVPASEYDGICKSGRARSAMQVIEDREKNDPSGAMLQLLACGVTGVCGQQGGATIADSATGSDGGKYTSKDPGSFVCRGLFLRGKVELKVGKDADTSSELTKAEMDKLMQQFPHFVEWYKVKPLTEGRYRLTLLPSSIQLSKEYSEEFIYP